MKNKKNLSQTAAAIRQCKRRAAESLDERKTRLTNDRKNKRIKRSLETSNQREAHLNRNRAQKLHHVDYKLHDADRLDSETDDALAHMQSESGSVMWPNIDDTAINEFNMPGYIAHAFPTLYPTGSADL
ncbi:unnamed protein product [Rhizophagus irregularis]|nr:unnamed protein product [Rhizophagus irregularis]